MTFDLEYGDAYLSVRSPVPLDVRGMRPAPSPVGPEAIAAALRDPIGTPSLLALGRSARAGRPDARAVVVVSDNTRPVPYRGASGLMIPLVRTLREAGFSDDHITVLVGAGSHRDMTPDEAEAMLGLEEAGMGGVRVVNHRYDDPAEQTLVGRLRDGVRVLVNRRYAEADLKIVTGLVESHFMAGASGGRKGICPGIVAKETLTAFHDARPLSSDRAADLVLDGNPIHDFSLEAAWMAGCDFLINATIDAEKRLTGVFAGDLEAAHRAAVEMIKSYVVVDLDRRYDVVLAPAGFVGINHYQAAKAAVEASRAVVPGGRIIVAARNTDDDPVGGKGYKATLDLFGELGPEGFMETIRSPGWRLIQEQWQVQMWCKVFDVIGGPEHFTYCALDIDPAEYARLPGRAGIIEFLTVEERRNLAREEAMTRMVERALAAAVANAGADAEAEKPAVLYLKDGPYGIPVVRTLAEADPA